MGTQVLLHVYDVTNSPDAKTNENILAINRVCRDYLVVGGIFHGAVEIFGEEWSYGYCPRGTGVFPCPPKQNPMYKFRETVYLGPTNKEGGEVQAILSRLKREWPGNRYDLLKRNCNHFCEELCRQLQVDPVPSWVNRFANMGQASLDLYVSVSDQVASAQSAIRNTSATWYSYLFPAAAATGAATVAPAPTGQDRGRGTPNNGKVPVDEEVVPGEEGDRRRQIGMNLPKFDAIPSDGGRS